MVLLFLLRAFDPNFRPERAQYNRVFIIVSERQSLLKAGKCKEIPSGNTLPIHSKYGHENFRWVSMNGRMQGEPL